LFIIKKILSTSGKGLAAVLPLALSVYLIYWLLSSSERLMRSVYLSVLPEDYYFTGLGTVLALVFLFLIGLLLQTFLLKGLLRLGEGIINRIPLVKSVYTSLRDFMDFITRSADSDASKVVAVSMPDGSKLIGLITAEEKDSSFVTGDKEERVGVFFPMSYQMGGYTLYYERKQLEELDIGVEEAMRIILTGGMTSKDKK